MDDATFWARGRECQVVELAQQGLQVTFAFERAMGWVVNRIKSGMFASSSRAREALQKVGSAGGLPAAPCFLGLGILTCVDGLRRGVCKPGRTEAALARFRLLGPSLFSSFLRSCFFLGRHSWCLGRRGHGHRVVGRRRRGRLGRRAALLPVAQRGSDHCQSDGQTD